MYDLIVDSFAGGGGASTGIELATGRQVDIAINHDPAAILMHKTNHPDTEHLTESVWDCNPRKVCKSRPVALAWFSPDCKHFSKAKGGTPCDKHIRGLAWDAVWWADTVRPRVILMENVEEIQTWGPLGPDGKPDITKKGRTFASFIKALRAKGYEVDWRELRACDYGAPTTRKRWYLIARCDGQPIVWPKTTHAHPDSIEARCGMLKPWRTAAEIIDWSIPCPSIFDRKKSLAENTLKRIARGLQKFVIEESEPFIVPIGYGERKGQEPRVHDINSPLNTVVSTCKQYLVTPYVTKFQQNSNGQILEKPIDTVMAGATRFGLVTPILTQYHSYDTDAARGQKLTEPILTLDTSNRYALTCAFLSKYFGGGYNGPGANVNGPLPTVTGIDHNAVVTSHLIAMYGTSTGSDLRQPVPTVTAIGQHIGEVRAFLIKYYGGDGNVGQPINKPLDTITSHDRFGLVMVHGEPYQIVDIGMRMLTPRELFNAQGFPEDYIISHDYTGKEYPKSEQVARCGNAVCPPVARALVESNLPELCEKRISSKLTI